MKYRTAGAFAALILGSMGAADLALAQYYPAPPPPREVYPAQPWRAAPAIDEDDGPFYDPPVVQSRPLAPPPPGIAQPAEAAPGANARYGRAYPTDPDTGVELVP